MHTYIVKNLSGTYEKTIQAENASQACILAFQKYGAHHKCKLYAAIA